MIEMLTLCLVSGAAALPVESAENRRARPAAGVVEAPSPGGEATLPALLRALHADAAKRSARNETSLIVLPVEEVMWSDGSLGCPQPGFAYTQALVPGWRVRIQSAIGLLSYHASRRGQWLLCTAAPDPAPATGAVPR